MLVRGKLYADVVDQTEFLVIADWLMKRNVVFVKISLLNLEQKLDAVETYFTLHRAQLAQGLSRS